MQTHVARWKAAAPEPLTGAHLYLDIAKSGCLFHGYSSGMYCMEARTVIIWWIYGDGLVKKLRCRLTFMLTHWGREMAAIFRTTFPDAFFLMKLFELRMHFDRILFPRVQLIKCSIRSDNDLSPVRRQAVIWTNAVLLLMMVSLLTHICVTRPQWIKPLRAELFCVNIKIYFNPLYDFTNCERSWNSSPRKTRIHLSLTWPIS